MFLYYFKQNRDFKDLSERVNFSLYNYGEIRNDKYLKEKEQLKKDLKRLSQ